ncbi:PilW family protein [Amphritea sp. HPY]|uniref:PilW family protein n=1 Tax=Amphritea sp. HPY TaxID=3421652 RepID=UPI003D7DE89F
MTSAMREQRGFSLVELMVALTVSLFLVLGVFQVFIATSDSNRTGQALARVQDNGRFALDYMIRDIRLTGYQGCIDLDTIEVNVIAKDPDIDVTIEPLRGFQINSSGSWTPAKLTEPDELKISGAMANDSDVIYIQHASPTGTAVDCPGGGFSCSADNANIHITDNNLGIEQNDLIIVTDCEAADLFRVTNNPKVLGNGNVTLAHANSNNTTNRLSKAYQADSFILKYLANAYYVKDTGRNSDNGDDIFALYRYDRGAREEFEIVAGVERINILFGQRLASGNLRFVGAADGSLNMDEVVAVRLSIMVVSNNRVRDTANTVNYNMAGTIIQPASGAGGTVSYPEDRRLRRVFSATVMLRNLN